jgi:hypothetical protein
MRSSIQNLVAKGKELGFISIDEIVEADAAFGNPDRLSSIVQTLSLLGIRVLGAHEHHQDVAPVTDSESWAASRNSTSRIERPPEIKDTAILKSPILDHQDLVTTSTTDARSDTAAVTSEKGPSLGISSDTESLQISDQINEKIVHEITFPDGRVYSGNLVEGLPHGYGRMLTIFGDEYTGHFSNGVEDGFGKMRWANGHIYEGNFASGTPHGSGVSISITGSEFSGAWKLGLRHGSGVLSSSSGQSYAGEWVEGVLSEPSGIKSETVLKLDKEHDIFLEKGLRPREKNKYKNKIISGAEIEEVIRKKYPDGRVYTGNIMKGTPHGSGQMRYTDGLVYSGGWKFGMPHGVGSYEYPDSRYYKGDFVDGLKEGYGEEKHADMSVYKGSYEEGLKHGTGAITIDGKVHAGEWECGDLVVPLTPLYSDNVQGKNEKKLEVASKASVKSARDQEVGFESETTPSIETVLYSNGDKFVGEIVGSKRNGVGTFLWFGESKFTSYSGQWLNDKMHGHGKLVYSSGDTYVGEFENDRKVGVGKYVWAKDKKFRSYVGEFENDQLDGIGFVNLLDGSQEFGQWKENERLTQKPNIGVDVRVEDGESGKVYASSTAPKALRENNKNLRPVNAVSSKKTVTSIEGSCNSCFDIFKIYSMRSLRSGYICANCYEKLKDSEASSSLPALIQWARDNKYKIKYVKGSYKIRKKPFGVYSTYSDKIQFAKHLELIRKSWEEK